MTKEEQPKCSICSVRIMPQQASTSLSVHGKYLCTSHFEEAGLEGGDMYTLDFEPYEQNGWTVENGMPFKDVGGSKVTITAERFEKAILLEFKSSEWVAAMEKAVMVSGYKWKNGGYVNIDDELNALAQRILDKKSVKLRAETAKNEVKKEKIMEQPKKEVKEALIINTCVTCKQEVPGAKALDNHTKKKRMICDSCEQKEEDQQKAVIESYKKKSNLPQESLPKQNALQGKSDAEIDKTIEDAKAKRFLEQRGSNYKVQGKERPDSHKIQQIANERKISIEILKAEQNDKYTEVIIRGRLGDQFVDAVVHHDFSIEFQLKSMEIIKNNPEILDHYEGLAPVIKEGAKIKQGDNIIEAKYYLIHTLLSFQKFSMRDARTKCAAIAEAMLLNRDWRDDEEKQSEADEQALVSQKR